MSRCLYLLFLPIFLNFSLSGATYHWNGAGVEGGTGDTDWFDAANWLVNDLVPGSGPGASDDVIIVFNEDYVDPEAGPEDDSFAIIIDQSANVASITASTLDKGTGAAIFVSANSQFGRLDLTTGSPTSARGSFYIDTGVTVQLYGGDISEDISTLRVSSSARSPFWGPPGTLEFSGPEVLLDVGTFNHPGHFRVTDPNAVVDMNNIALESPAFLYSTQTILNPTTFRGDVTSMDSLPLNNLADVLLIETNRTVNNYDAGTYRGYRVLINSTAANDSRFFANGDITLAGMFEENGEDFAIYVDRRGNATRGSRINLQGHNLTTTSTGIIQIGLNAAEIDPYIAGYQRIEADGSTVDLGGTLRFGTLGYIEGNAATQLILRGSLESVSTMNEDFNLANSAVAMLGNGTFENPQTLELLGANLGLDEDGFIDNFAFGSLTIGDSEDPTYVRLQDNFDFSGNGSDTLYLGSLLVNEGSTLDLNHHTLYAMYEGDLTEVLPGDDRFGDGLIVIPEPKLAALLLPALLLGFARRLRTRS